MFSGNIKEPEIYEDQQSQNILKAAQFEKFNDWAFRRRKISYV
jgi:hypothetical protein